MSEHDCKIIRYDENVKKAYFSRLATNATPTPTPTTTATPTATPTPTPTATPVGIVQNLTATRQAGVDIYVSWSAPLDFSASDYEVEYRPLSGVETSFLTVGAPYYTIDLNTMDIGTQYEIRVRAISGELENGPWSEYVLVTAADVPAAPSISVDTDGFEQGAVTITIMEGGNNGSSYLSYDVEFDLDGTWSTPTLANYTDFTAGQFNKTITGLGGGTQYYFRVRFVNEVGNGEWSSSNSANASATPPNQVGNFGAGIGVDESGPEPVAIWVFDWFAAPGDGGSEITGYEIQEDSSENFTAPTSYYPLAGDTSYSTNIVVADSVRYFRIRAINSIGSSAWSAVSNIIYNTPYPPSTPEITSAFWSGTQTIISFTVNDGGSPITSYEFFFNQSAASPDYIVGNQAFYSYNYSGGFTVSMTATNSVGSSGESSAVTVGSVPDAPYDVSATISNGDLNVTYTTPGSDGGSTITEYRFYIDGTLVTPISTAPESATFSGGYYEGTTITVSAINGYGEGPQSAGYYLPPAE